MPITLTEFELNWFVKKKLLHIIINTIYCLLTTGVDTYLYLLRLMKSKPVNRLNGTFINSIKRL